MNCIYTNEGMPGQNSTHLWDCVFNKDTANGMILSGILYFPYLLNLYLFLQKSQWWSSGQLRDYQNKRLEKLINHAYEHVPYYRRSFQRAGIVPKDIRSIEDIPKLPLLTKQQVRNNINDFIACNYPAFRMEPMSTGGTTGDPLTFFIDRGKTVVNHLAFYLTMLKRANCQVHNRYLFITQSNELWRHQTFGRILILSPYSLRDENYKILAEKIKKLNPHYIIGFPSAVTLLGHILEKKKEDLFPDLNAIFCSGETLYEWQRNFLENIYSCKIFAFYAQCEQAIFAATCECSQYYHVFPEYGVTELIDKDGHPITREGEKGEIVGTGFTNDIFPFIRYRIGDMGIYTHQKCSCGRQYQLLKKIEGRTQEFIRNKKGDELPMTGMYGIVPSSSNQVREYQFFQPEPGELELRIVRCSGFTHHDEKLILQRLSKTLGSEFQLSVQYVDSVHRTSAGKIQFLVKK